jgi:hypothetical protein
MARPVLCDQLLDLDQSEKGHQLSDRVVAAATTGAPDGLVVGGQLGPGSRHFVRALCRV